MGDDEYHPISRKGSNLTKAGGVGYTVIDSIDTMLLMGLDAEYQRARHWVANRLTFERDGNFNTFEVSHDFPVIVRHSNINLDNNTSLRRPSFCPCSIGLGPYIS